MICSQLGSELVSVLVCLVCFSLVSSPLVSNVLREVTFSLWQILESEHLRESRDFFMVYPKMTVF